MASPTTWAVAQVDEHNAPLQDLDAERRMNRGDDQTDDEGGRYDLEQVKVDRGLPPAAPR